MSEDFQVLLEKTEIKKPLFQRHSDIQNCKLQSFARFPLIQRKQFNFKTKQSSIL